MRILALLFLPLAAFAADERYAQVEAALQALLPGIEADRIGPAPMEGFAEVLVGAQVVYVSLDGQYLLDGQVIEVPTRRNLSEAARGEVRRDLLANVSEDERIIFPAKGTRKHRVLVFTDIDCGYCRRLHQQMAEYNELGIEVDYLMFPRGGIGSASYDKAVSVWCADDRNAALTAAKAGRDPKPAQCSNPIEDHYELGRTVGVTGTPALVAEDGTLIPGYVPPDSLAQRLDGLRAE